MKSAHDYFDGGFYNYLRSLDDLVVIMDESHHYRAAQSMEAINNLQPILGLELTATPQVQQGKNIKLFENVVYEYPLSKAIKDGYTRTPYALTRKDIKSYNFNDDELDMTMINDGITHHENIKLELIQYAHNNGKKLVKPFMLIVCKDTAHAQKVFEYMKSNAFMEGKYADKVIMVHSNQKGAEKEENVQLLLDVEKTEKPEKLLIDWIRKVRELSVAEDWYASNHTPSLSELCRYAQRTVHEVIDLVRDECKRLDDVDELLDLLCYDAWNMYKFYQEEHFDHLAELAITRKITLGDIVSDIARNK